MNEPGQHNPFEAPEVDTAPEVGDCPKTMELLPICMMTGALEPLYPVTQTLECGPVLLKTGRDMAFLGSFMFAGFVSLNLRRSGHLTMQLLAISSGTIGIAAVMHSMWMLMRHSSVVTFFVTENIWKKERGRRRAWTLAAVLLVVALAAFVWATDRHWIPRTPLRDVTVPNALLVAIFIASRNAIVGFERPTLTLLNGQPMLKVTHRYSETAEYIERISESMTDEELDAANATIEGPKSAGTD